MSIAPPEREFVSWDPPVLDILFEDSRLLAAAKPSGRLVIPGRGGPAAGGEPRRDEPLQREVERHLGAKAYVVHRLDRGASGVVLFAKDPEAHRALCVQFEGRQVGKVYLALAQGRVAADGLIEAPLREFGSGRAGVDPRGKPSATGYRVAERFASATLLEVRPLTGRRHQIRVHLHSIGHPILGDTLYGRPLPVGGAARLMLHAWRLSVTDPSGRPLRIEAEPPEDFRSIVASARGS